MYRIRELREDRDLSQSDIAKVIKTTQQQYSKIETGKADISGEKLILLALYHTSAFAYVKGRCTVDAVKRHQQNHSRWFAKLDFSDFFGSTTLQFVVSMFSQIFPFSEIVKYEDGMEALKKALSLCFLNGGLPQGTPISPTITNIMMIPIDHYICNALRKKNFVYTRYADDMIISSKYSFDCNEIQTLVLDTLKKFRAPFQLNTKKTRYGSSAGQNWNLGLMLNKDNEITVGHKAKKNFRAMCCNYIQDHKKGILWDPHDLQVLLGHLSYYRMIEAEYFDGLLKSINQKFGVDLESMVKSDLFECLLYLEQSFSKRQLHPSGYLLI